MTSDAFSAEKRRTMQAYGARLAIVPCDEGRINAALIKRMVDVAAEISSKPDASFVFAWPD